MVHDIERRVIYRNEFTAEEIAKVPGLDEVLFPTTTEIQWQSDGSFLLLYTEQGNTEYFHLSQAMLKAINEANV